MDDLMRCTFSIIFFQQIDRPTLCWHDVAFIDQHAVCIELECHCHVVVSCCVSISQICLSTANTVWLFVLVCASVGRSVVILCLSLILHIIHNFPPLSLLLLLLCQYRFLTDSCRRSSCCFSLSLLSPSMSCSSDWVVSSEFWQWKLLQGCQRVTQHKLLNITAQSPHVPWEH